jgi:hypothetical protein
MRDDPIESTSRRPEESPGQGPCGEKGNTLGNNPSGTLFTTTADVAISDAERRVVDGILARINAPGGYDAFTTQVRAVRACRRPVRLSGRIIAQDADGHHQMRFTSRSLPDGVLLKACGSRRESVCPPCASLYRGDAFALVAAGLRGGKGVPEEIGDHPAVLLTLTAPSFGPVHRQRPDGSCHPWGHQCPHGGMLICSARHDDSDELLGQALCPDCYDYEGAVLFNAGVSELWRRTTIYALRALGSLLGMSAREAARQLRLSYVKVVEFQRRGSVHLHVLVRADRRGDELGEAPEGIDADTVAAALRIAAAKVSAPIPGDRRIAWGQQVDTAVVTEAENGRRRAAAYLAKYATKGSDEYGVLDHRFRSGTPRDDRLPDHLKELVETAWRLGDQAETEDLRLRLWAHTCGFRGHFLTKSRRYSTTFGELRADRQRWRIARRGESDAADDSAADDIEFREWTYEGSGYRTAGDVCLARNVEEELRLGRMVAREGWEVTTPTGDEVAGETVITDTGGGD